MSDQSKHNPQKQPVKQLVSEPLKLYGQFPTNSAFTFSVDVTIYSFHLCNLLRGGFFGGGSNPETTPVGCVPRSPLHPTEKKTK